MSNVFYFGSGVDIGIQIQYILRNQVKNIFHCVTIEIWELLLFISIINLSKNIYKLNSKVPFLTFSLLLFIYSYVPT